MITDCDLSEPHPPWQVDIARALGKPETEPLTWEQVIGGIYTLREDLDHWKPLAVAWQDWAREVLGELGRQPLYGEHGDGPAREVIAQLAGMAPAVPRCANCGCFSTRHLVDEDDVGLMDCVDCECAQYEHDTE